MQPAIATKQEILAEKIRSRTAKVGVIGLGYVGLPLAVEFANAGFSVTGIDVQTSRVAELNSGSSYIQDVLVNTFANMWSPVTFVRLRIFQSLRNWIP